MEIINYDNSGDYQKGYADAIKDILDNVVLMDLGIIDDLCQDRGILTYYEEE